MVEFVVKKAKKKEAPPKQRDDDYVVGKGTGAGPAKYDWDEVGGAALSNLGKSAKENFVDPFLHPIDTLSGIAGLGADAFRKAGGFVAPEGTFGETPTLDALLNHYAETYGSGEGFRRALAEDPFGPIGDLSTIVSGGAGLAGKAAAAGGRVAKIARVAGKVADAFDPVGLALEIKKGANVVVPKISGRTTGVGEANLRNATEAGRQGGQPLKILNENLRGRPTDFVSEARDAVDNIDWNAQQKYNADTNRLIKGNQTPVDYTPVWKSYNDASDTLSFGGKWTGGEHSKRTGSKLLDDIYEFDVGGSRIPEGMLGLRKRTQSYRTTPGPGTASDVKQSNRLIESVKRGVDSELESKVPGFKQMNRDYATEKSRIKELESEFSLGERSSDATGWRKLVQSMGDNFAANYGRRAEMANELEAAGAKGLKPAIAGQAGRSLLPRGLGSLGSTALAAGGLLSFLPAAPAAIIAGLGMSPRLATETAKYLGTVDRKVGPKNKARLRVSGKIGSRGARVANEAETQKEKFYRQFLLDNPEWQGQ